MQVAPHNCSKALANARNSTQYIKLPYPQTLKAFALKVIPMQQLQNIFILIIYI